MLFKEMFESRWKRTKHRHQQFSREKCMREQQIVCCLNIVVMALHDGFFLIWDVLYYKFSIDWSFWHVVILEYCSVVKGLLIIFEDMLNITFYIKGKQCYFCLLGNMWNVLHFLEQVSKHFKMLHLVWSCIYSTCI